MTTTTLPLQTIPIEYGTSYTIYLGVEREEVIYLNGNERKDLKFEDCFPWTEALQLANKCSNKCLPVVSQNFFEGRTELPKCHKPFDHLCMTYSWLTAVRTLYTYYHYQFSISNLPYEI